MQGKRIACMGITSYKGREFLGIQISMLFIIIKRIINFNQCKKVQLICIVTHLFVDVEWIVSDQFEFTCLFFKHFLLMWFQMCSLFFLNIFIQHDDDHANFCNFIIHLLIHPLNSFKKLLSIW